MMTVMMMLMCVVYFQRARQEIIKVGGWVGLRKMEGKMGGSREKNEKISTTVKPERERALGVHFLGKKRSSLLAEACVLCCALFLFLFLFLFFFKVCMYNLVCVCIYTREMLVFSIFIPLWPRTLQFVSGHPFSLA